MFFPKKCVGCKRSGGYLCTDCFARLDFSVSPICAVCSRPAVSGLTHPACKTRYSIDGVFSALVYQGIAKKLLYQFKFSPYLSDLAPLLGELFYEGLIQQEAFFQAKDGEDLVFLPIPLHPSRFRSRGYNQSLLLALDLGKRFQIPVTEMLQRKKRTPTQVGLSQDERRTNIVNAFQVTQKNEPLPKTVFLVDDILTSGATLNEAAKVLKKGGVEKVWEVTLAHGS